MPCKKKNALYAPIYLNHYFYSSLLFLSSQSKNKMCKIVCVCGLEAVVLACTLNYQKEIRLYFVLNWSGKEWWKEMIKFHNLLDLWDFYVNGYSHFSCNVLVSFAVETGSVLKL